MGHKTNTAQGTLPDRSNLTLNALLERKWNAEGKPKECQNFRGAGVHSEQECVLLRIRERIPLRTYGLRRDCDVTVC